MSQTEPRKPDGIAQHDTQIRSAAFLTIIILASLLVGMVALGDYFLVRYEAIGKLTRKARQDAFVLNATIDDRLERAEIAAGSDQVRAIVLGKAGSPSAERAALQQELASLASHGFAAIAVTQPDGGLLEDGQWIQNTGSAFHVRAPLNTELLWNHGFYLQTAVPVKDTEGNIIGQMLSQQSVPVLNEILLRDLSGGTSYETFICAPFPDGPHCLSSRSHNAPFRLDARSDGRLPTIQRALAGQVHQQFRVRSPFGHVAVAGIPVGETGLALIGTIGAWQSLLPLFLQVGATALIVALLLWLAQVLLRRYLTPLVTELLEEKERSLQNYSRFIAASDSSLNAFFVYESVRDNTGEIVDFRFVFLNRNAEKLIHRTSAEVVGKLLCQEIPVTRTGGFFEKYKKVVETGVPLNEEVAIASQDVDATWLQYQIVRLGDGFALTASDISERKRMELSLAQSLQFTQAVIDGSPFCTIVTDREGLIVAVNPAAERMLWYSRAEMVGKLTPVVLHDPVEIQLRAQQLSHELGEEVEPGMQVFFVRPRRGVTEEGQWTYIRKDGSRLPVQLTVTALFDEKGEVTGYLGIAYDITERKRQEDYISHIAHHDSLTGLPTRLLFRDRVDVALNRIQRDGGRCAVMLIDLDNFKTINDSLGHHAGDEVLVVVARRLTNALRATDTISRMGGDEFTVLLDQVDSAQTAEQIASKLIDVLSKPVLIGDDRFSISASIGVSLYPDAGTNSAQLLKNADTAMYHAKGAGKHGFRLFNQRMADAATRRLQFEMALKHALEADEFRLVYQPQISLATGEIVGVEALARWTSAKLGPVSPADFIPVAEHSGVIGALGEWVLRTACREIHELNQLTGSNLRVGVNLSPRQLERAGFFLTVRQVLAETALPPGLLDIEITEGILMNDSLQVWDALRELHEFGVQMSIDDFGTGFCNVSYLLKLAVNRIKIDRSFIQRIEDDPGANAVVTSLISMARDLGVSVIAEGVETQAQSEIIREKGCHEAQGYFFGEPMLLSKLSQRLKETLVQAPGSASAGDRVSRQSI